MLFVLGRPKKCFLEHFLCGSKSFINLLILLSFLLRRCVAAVKPKPRVEHISLVFSGFLTMVSIIVLFALDLKLFLHYLTLHFRSFEDEESVIDLLKKRAFWIILVENVVQNFFFLAILWFARIVLCYYRLEELSLRYRLYAYCFLSENGLFALSVSRFFRTILICWTLQLSWRRESTNSSVLFSHQIPFSWYIILIESNCICELQLLSTLFFYLRK